MLAGSELGGRRTWRIRHHHRHGTGRRRQVHVLLGLAERLQFGDHVDGDEAGTLERLQQAIAAVQQLLDLLAGQLTAPSQFAEHPLAVGARLVDHLPALLLGHRQLGLGVGCRVGAPACRLDLGLLAQAARLLGGLVEHLRGGLLGLLTDLDAALACGRQHPCGLLAEQPRQCGIIELRRIEVGIGLRGSQLALEESLAFLQPAELGGDHAQEVADFGLVEPAAAGTEAGIGDRRRRRRVGSGQGHGHGTTLRSAWLQMVAISARSGRESVQETATSGSPPSSSRAASASSRVATGMISTSPRPASSEPLESLGGLQFRLGRRHEEDPDPALMNRRHLLGQPTDRSDVAVEVDRARHRHVLLTGELTRRQLVDQRQREGQPRRRTPDVAGVDVDLERQIDRPGVERHEPDDRATPDRPATPTAPP